MNFKSPKREPFKINELKTPQITRKIKTAVLSKKNNLSLSKKAFNSLEIKNSIFSKTSKNEIFQFEQKKVFKGNKEKIEKIMKEVAGKVNDKKTPNNSDGFSNNFDHKENKISIKLNQFQHLENFTNFPKSRNSIRNKLMSNTNTHTRENFNSLGFRSSLGDKKTNFTNLNEKLDEIEKSLKTLKVKITDKKDNFKTFYSMDNDIHNNISESSSNAKIRNNFKTCKVIDSQIKEENYFKSDANKNDIIISDYIDKKTTRPSTMFSYKRIDKAITKDKDKENSSEKYSLNEIKFKNSEKKLKKNAKKKGSKVSNNQISHIDINDERKKRSYSTITKNQISICENSFIKDELESSIEVSSIKSNLENSFNNKNQITENKKIKNEEKKIKKPAIDNNHTRNGNELNFEIHLSKIDNENKIKKKTPVFTNSFALNSYLIRDFKLGEVNDAKNKSKKKYLMAEKLHEFNEKKRQAIKKEIPQIFNNDDNSKKSKLDQEEANKRKLENFIKEKEMYDKNRIVLYIFLF